MEKKINFKIPKSFKYILYIWPLASLIWLSNMLNLGYTHIKLVNVILPLLVLIIWSKRLKVMKSEKYIYIIKDKIHIKNRPFSQYTTINLKEILKVKNTKGKLILFHNNEKINIFKSYLSQDDEFFLNNLFNAK